MRIAPPVTKKPTPAGLIDPSVDGPGLGCPQHAHAAPHRREVIHEASLDIEGARKAPDYAFRFGAETVFYVEAKKPGIAIKTAGDAAFQLRRYAWSAKLPLSVLTDFEELAVYDCRLRPADTDKASIARVNYYTYDQYPDLWPEIWDVSRASRVRRIVRSIRASVQRQARHHARRCGISQRDRRLARGVGAQSGAAQRGPVH